MDHHAPLLTTLALGFVMASACAFVATRLKLPALVGYLAAGIVIGPHTPGFVGDSAIAAQLAEVGVILLMFGVGLHFSLGDLLAVKWIAIPGAVAQIAVATALGVGIASTWGWSLPAGLVLGLALSVASTVVVLRALEEQGALARADGRIAVAWLIVEDLAMVLTLVLLPTVAGLSSTTSPSTGTDVAPPNVLLAVAGTLAKIGLFLVLVVVAGPRAVPWMLAQAARTGSREIFTLSVLAIAIGIAYGASAFFGVSFALGAFCAGIVLSRSELSHRAAEDSLPLQHAFSVIFFVSVGMLFDPRVLWQQPGAVLAVLFTILIGKSIGAFAIVQLLGYPLRTALTVSVCLAQIGEFSFILASLGISLGIFPPMGLDLVLAGALVSLCLNPLMFATVEPLRAWLRRYQRLFARLEPRQELRLARLQAELNANARATAAVAVPADELLGRWPVFADLALSHRAALLALLKPRWATPGERLIRRGEIGDEAFFVSAGAVEVAVDGRRVRLGPGDFFGEMAVLAPAPRSADVTAVDYTQLFTLDRQAFATVVGLDAGIRDRIEDIATRRRAENLAGGGT